MSFESIELKKIMLFDRCTFFNFKNLCFSHIENKVLYSYQLRWDTYIVSGVSRVGSNWVSFGFGDRGQASVHDLVY